MGGAARGGSPPPKVRAPRCLKTPCVPASRHSELAALYQEDLRTQAPSSCHSPSPVPGAPCGPASAGASGCSPDNAASSKGPARRFRGAAPPAATGKRPALLQMQQLQSRTGPYVQEPRTPGPPATLPWQRCSRFSKSLRLFSWHGFPLALSLVLPPHHQQNSPVGSLSFLSFSDSHLLFSYSSSISLFHLSLSSVSLFDSSYSLSFCLQFLSLCLSQTLPTSPALPPPLALSPAHSPKTHHLWYQVGWRVQRGCRIGRGAQLASPLHSAMAALLRN